MLLFIILALFKGVWKQAKLQQKGISGMPILNEGEASEHLLF